MLNQQDVIPIIDAGVLHGMLRTFENLPKEQQTKETYIALYGYYNTGDSHSAAWVMDYHFPEIFGSGTEVAMSPADFNEIKQQAKLLEGKPEHDKLIVVGAGHTHPNLGADFLSKPDKSIHQIFNRMGALGTGAKIKMSLSKEPSYGKEGEVPVVAIVFDPFSQELTIFYKRLKDKEYKASAGLYIIGHAEADREITRNVEVVFQTDEDIKQKRSTRSSLSIR